MEMYNPPHPGKILKDLYLVDYKLSVTAFALKLGVSRTTASELVNCKNGISAEMALKLAKAFNTSAQFWLNMQVQYDLWQAKQTVNLDNVEVIAM
ncbi:MAG: HigA family addiction module antitoxin [Candidatus Gastranaerophilales bacterium]|nr:HigA family addiction module antitoxin [Candidatus Gastranaerophilales bacterium]